MLRPTLNVLSNRRNWPIRRNSWLLPVGMYVVAGGYGKSNSWLLEVAMSLSAMEKAIRGYLQWACRCRPISKICFGDCKALEDI